MKTEIVVFVLTFLFIFLIYELFLVRKCKKDKKRKKPVEVQYLVNRYQLDLKKINYKRLLNLISIVSSLDISLVVTLMSIFDGFLLQLGIGFLGTIMMIVISYSMIGMIYKKKGCCKNG